MSQAICDPRGNAMHVPFARIADFMFALGDLEPGREVEIEVDRGGARVPLKVIPAPGR